MARTFWIDALLVVVTLGLYAPYWLWERNRGLRRTYPEADLSENLWWIVGALVLTFGGAALAFGDDFFSVVVQILAVVSFTVGVFILARNGEAAADAMGIDWSVPAEWLAGLVGAAFLAVQIGNLFESLLIRGPALLLLFSLPFLFYKVWDDLDLLIDEPASPAEPAGEA